MEENTTSFFDAGFILNPQEGKIYFLNNYSNK